MPTLPVPVPGPVLPAESADAPTMAFVTPKELVVLEMAVRKQLTDHFGQFDLYDNICVDSKGQSVDIRDVKDAETAERIRAFLENAFPAYRVIHARVTVEDLGDQEFVRMYPKRPGK